MVWGTSIQERNGSKREYSVLINAAAVSVTAVQEGKGSRLWRSWHVSYFPCHRLIFAALALYYYLWTCLDAVFRTVPRLAPVIMILLMQPYCLNGPYLRVLSGTSFLTIRWLQYLLLSTSTVLEFIPQPRCVYIKLIRHTQLFLAVFADCCCDTFTCWM